MKPTLVAGIHATRRFTVDRERTIDFMGEEARVYATPMLVRDIEVTVSSASGRAITFEVEGRDDREAICRGRHMRFVVDVAKTRERLRQKRAA